MPSTNHLANETSPYLQQHAHNPVDWYPWGEEAITLARQQKKPILLSIGYAACHWCHVMAHESFEDEETAALMNELFINIKVDREERPDLDKVFQSAHYLLTQSAGGWPLTVFLSPDDLTPFFSGTYFPKNPRYQLPAFKEVLKTLSDIFQKNPTDIRTQNQELQKVLQSQNTGSSTNISLNKKPLEMAEVSISRIYDVEFGGFGSAPKFPRPTILEFLLKNKSEMALNTLRHMAEGGIYDQLEGGFFRYSVDEKWQIPHFEKMLYDNGQLLFLYVKAAKQTKNLLFFDTIRQTAEWALTKMQSPEGGYYSSLDADTEGHEGKFYIWNKFEIEELLDEEEAQFADDYFGLHELPNFEKHWHLHVATSLEFLAKKLNITEKKAHEIVARIRQTLLAAREQRIHPACDKKILTAWNALMIKGMLAAGNLLQEPRYIASAERALHFIQQKLWKDNQLFATYKDEKTRVPAFLDDYAFLLDALVYKLKISWNTDHLAFATKLADKMLSDFSDTESGGFFFTGEHYEKILYRPKTFIDESLPSGNGVAARALLKLGNLINEPRYVNAAEKTLSSAWSFMLEFPTEHCSLLLGLKEFFESPHCSLDGCGDP